MSTSEKLPLTQPPPPVAPRSRRRPWLASLPTFVAAAGLYLVATHASVFPWSDRSSHADLNAARCPQVEPLRPTVGSDGLDRMVEYVAGPQFRKETIARMAGAIQIPSEAYDDMGAVGEDSRWDIMYDVSAYLEKTFPLVHKHLTLERVNTHGLLYTWTGSDESLKPSVLMAHQDVVPVAKATVGDWEHPPFSGAFDGTYIWGRGAQDCKDSLVGILEAIELLLEADFKPRRTTVLSFGFDEEISGGRGASRLAEALLDRYGKNGVASIVDEGGGFFSAWGADLAIPAVGEKGYIDVNITVRMPGGHSSAPHPHTGIGVMSELITLIEAHPYEASMSSDNPFGGTLQCGAAHGSEFPGEIKKLLPSPHRALDKKKSHQLELELNKLHFSVPFLFKTSQAVDMISGGVKANALPERTTALVNHRVNIGEQPSDVQAKLTKLAGSVAEKYNLTLNAFNDKDESPSSITLSSRKDVLSPAPVSPTSIDTTTPYSVLSGTTRALYGEKVIVAPSLMAGNTDTRYYWDLTNHIFRFAPGWTPEEDNLDGIHSVGERLSVRSHIKLVQWYGLFVRNMDEADL